MKFVKGELFHIYNRGNNRDKVFYSRRNYLFFLEKMNLYISPYADIVAWCLMPNHFHLLVYVNEVELIPITDPVANNGGVAVKTRTLNQSIGIMLRSYTNAIQKQEGRTGALFQEETKAILLTDDISFTPSYFTTPFGTIITAYQDDDKSYAEQCFHYIHQNPVSSHMVKRPEDWEFSSYRDYCGLRKGKLVNRAIGMEFFKEER
jgi:putative transposase